MSETTCIYIFDVDGTLYSQKSMRIRMGLSLIGYYLFHPTRIKELLMIQTFRKLREKEEYKAYSVEDLAALISPNAFSVIDKWMFTKPLKVIVKCAYTEVLDFINSRPDDVKIVIYSDYPAAEKINALGLKVDYIFTSEDPEIKELKPDKQAMEHILNTVNTQVEKYIYVGDRDCKDGASARTVGMRYIDIIDFRKGLA